MAVPRTRLARLIAAAVLLPATALLVLAPSAAARVTIVPGTVPGGGTETLAVRAATDRGATPTDRVELEFPADLPIERATVTPTAGWRSEVLMRDGDGSRESVRSIVWSGGEIRAGLFEQFLVKAGPLPDEGTLTFTVRQTHADGSTEQWTADGPTLSVTPDGLPAPAVAAPAPPVADATAGLPADLSSPLTPEADAAETSWWTWAAVAAVLLGGAGLAQLIIRPRGRRAPRRHSRHSAHARFEDPATAADPTGPGHSAPEHGAPEHGAPEHVDAEHIDAAQLDPTTIDPAQFDADPATTLVERMPALTAHDRAPEAPRRSPRRVSGADLLAEPLLVRVGSADPDTTPTVAFARVSPADTEVTRPLERVPR